MIKQVLKPEDIDLFRQRTQDVKPLTHKTAELQRARSSRRIRSETSTSMTDSTVTSGTLRPGQEMEAVAISSDDYLQFRRPGIQDRVFRKLQRGQLPITDELDLHGMTAYRAQIALDQFMEQIQNSGKQICVRIIHGKGYGSRDGLPVIKRQTQLWLQCNINVLAYCSCRPADGGTGAVYVLVKSIT